MVNQAYKKAAEIYDYLIGILCIALLIIFTAARGANVSNVLLFAILVIASIAIDTFSIHVGKAVIALTSTMELASFLILGMVASAWIQMLFILIIDYIINKKPMTTVMLNLGMMLSTVYIGSFCYQIIDHLAGNPEGVFLWGIRMLPSIGFLISGILINYILFSVHMLLIDRDAFKQLFKSSLPWDLVSTAISLPVALEFTSIYLFSKGNNLLFALLFILTIIFISYIFSLSRKIIFANNQLKALSKVALTINSFLNLDRTYNSIIDAISSLVTFKGCYIFDINDKENKMVPAAFRVDDRDNPEEYRLIIADALLKKIADSPKPIIINELQKELKRNNENQYFELYKSCILVPMKRLNKCVGCIGVFSDDVRAFDDDILEFLMILSDQAAIAIENARLYKLSEEKATTDGLTNLYNQRYFYNWLGENIDQYSDKKRIMSLMIFDIDHFKDVNDIYGHTIGDRVLKEVAQLIRSLVRKNDIVSRYGGEEFTVILPELNSDEAFVIAERIRGRIEEHDFLIDGFNIKVTVSGGISEFPKIASNDVELVNYADRAMYIGAKYKGRNKIKIYSEKLA